MDFTKLLFQHNANFNKKSKYNIKIEKGFLVFNFYEPYFDDRLINKMIASINYAHSRYGKTKIPIRLVFLNADLTDKLSYTILECVCESLIKDFGHLVEVAFNIKANIMTAGMLSSPVMLLRNDRNKSLLDKNIEFLKKFDSEIYMKHFRRVMKANDEDRNEKINQLYDDVANFQKHLGIESNCFEDISEVIVELVGNALEHSDSDCLLDVDIVRDYVDNNNDPVCAINISVLNFSKCVLGEGIRSKIECINSEENINLSCDESKYFKVKEAYENHKEHFDVSYCEEDFYNISAFQHKVSGRKEFSATGGTGLTKLIKRIEERSLEHACYVMSGKRKILFLQEHLEYTNDGWIGFNKDNDYINHIPDPSVLYKNAFFFPGTAYNLSFIIKENNDEQ